MSFVRIRELRKTYDTGESRVTPLDGIDLDIAAGEFLCLMGPSGSGKTTLLNIVAGIDRQTSGSVRVGDVELSRLSDSQLSGWRNRNMGYVFQQFNLVPVLNALENVELPLMLLPLSAKRRRRQAEIALGAVGLSDRLKHYPRQLSGGQQQRVAIARAIVTDPAIIAADEPTGNLDAQSGEEVLRLLSELNRRFKKTVIMVTHDPRAAATAQRILHLDKGVLHESGTLHEEVEAGT
ncbi:MAG: ABC transporter ATP-binding protein [Planctomycetes bacterium]|nr:ABC transporter ATP-binding protein [Planctomycetota bacterium]MCW8135096.1 ABC transporter ATP-binding protein [Planctomycetota bacterium]